MLFLKKLSRTLAKLHFCVLIWFTALYSNLMCLKSWIEQLINSDFKKMEHKMKKNLRNEIKNLSSDSEEHSWPHFYSFAVPYLYQMTFFAKKSRNCDCELPIPSWDLWITDCLDGHLHSAFSVSTYLSFLGKKSWN